MMIFRFAFDRVAARLIALGNAREPDFLIGRADRPYLRRWWLIPRNRVCNVYLHQILRDDDDRALHDHPWANFSIVLDGGYWDVTADRGGHLRRQWLGAGAVKPRLPWAAHRIEVGFGQAWTLFFTGPRVRQWGFWCERGWIAWKEFTAEADSGGG